MAFIPTAHSKLTDAELDQLEALLADIGDTAMNIEQLDGFFVALLCSPSAVMASEYLPHVWGEGYEFESQAALEDFVDLAMRHWNSIMTTLMQSLKKSDHLYYPILLEDEHGVAFGNRWARGFMHGVSLRRRDWADLIDDEEEGGSILPMMLLAGEHSEDASLRPPMEITPEIRESLISMMVAGANRIYRHFEPHRRRLVATAASASQIRRIGEKVGRNAPCPCGSGRKFKQCCVDGSATVH